jgi:hypothetical protein
MPDTSTLWRDGALGYFSCSRDSFTLSPVYVTVATAHRLIRLEGGHVDLPDGYDADVLESIMWHTGHFGREVYITKRQAGEVAEIASTLIEEHADALAPGEREAALTVIRVVTTDTESET